MAQKILNSRIIAIKPSSKEVLLAAFMTAFQEIFGWTASSSVLTSQIDNSLSLKSELISDESSDLIRLSLQSKEDESGLSVSSGVYDVIFDNSKTYYLCYFISPNKRTFSFNISTEETFAMAFIVAASNNTKHSQAGFRIGGATSENGYIYNGRGILTSDLEGTCYNNQLRPDPANCTSISTAPNVYASCFFEELYCIVCSPTNNQDINKCLFLINGNYYKPITNGLTIGNFAILIA